ncbi:unnamed protein product [Durusdinium trenchii]|uniref:GYF domain-containing protein n=1 Tax=Durusdinium trenchii TaxID=1381693 RepID=A0ABP0LKJ7_9DINO
MLGVMALRYWLVSVVCSFSTRSELRDALLQWYHADEATKLHLPHGAPGGWDVSSVTNMSGLFKDLERFNENISAWDTSKVVDMSSMFFGATAFNMPIGEWNTSRVQSMSKMFFKATKFNQPIGSWKTAAVVDMSLMFCGASSFDQPINAWDTAGVRNMKGMFYAATKFNQPIDLWKTAAVVDMSFMFQDASSFDQLIGAWDTAKVRDMSSMFYEATKFNQPIGSWKTAAVVDMSLMFWRATSFDQPISAWNTAKVRDMNSMFYQAKKFNQPIGSWNTAAVVDMSWMFYGASSFDQPIGGWDTAKVRNMNAMFYEATKFNHPIGLWKTSAVVDMGAMFYGASSFDQPIGAWDTAGVKNMKAMFYQAKKFNQPIGSWKTTAVVDMSFMFQDASSFDQPIGAWEIGNVKDMHNMFAGAVVFNQPIGLWNTSAVTNMHNMFYGASTFNRPTGDWDTAEVRDMSGMFAVATSFDQPIGAWDTSRVKSMHSMFDQAVSFNQPLNDWDTGLVTNFSAMFIRARSFDQPVGMWDTSAATDMRDMFSGARSFNQPLSTWNFTSIPDETAMSNAFAGSGMSDCVLGASSEAVGLPPRVSRPWAYSACPSCPCPQTNLACVDGACRPVNSGFIELGKGLWHDVNATPATVVGFRACASSCEASDCFALLLEESGHCLLIHEPRLTRDTAPNGSSRGRTAFRRTSCGTFSCPAGTVPTPTTRSKESEVEVSAAACCRCSASNQVRDRSKEPDLVCVVCPAGRAAKNDECHACTEGYAPEGASQCAACPTGEVPHHGRTDCTPCAPGEYADGETCRLCRFPRFLNGNNCIWWHLPMIVLVLLFFSALVFLGHRVTKRRRKRWTERREEEVNQILQQLEQELWHEKLNTMNRFFVALNGFGWTWNQVCQRAEEIRARHSAHAGVSLAYLMGDFSRVAYDWSGEDDPTFLRLKEVFWQGEEKLGSDIPCPRDGRPGCALVDWLSPEHRQMQTHFMISRGESGIDDVTSSLCHVNVADARAFDPRDEEKGMGDRNIRRVVAGSGARSGEVGCQEWSEDWLKGQVLEAPTADMTGGEAVPPGRVGDRKVRAMDRLRSDALARQSDELRRTLRERVGPVSPPSLAAFFMFWLCEEDIDPEPEVGGQPASLASSAQVGLGSGLLIYLTAQAHDVTRSSLVWFSCMLTGGLRAIAQLRTTAPQSEDALLVTVLIFSCLLGCGLPQAACLKSEAMLLGVASMLASEALCNIEVLAGTGQVVLSILLLGFGLTGLLESDSSERSSAPYLATSSVAEGGKGSGMPGASSGDKKREKSGLGYEPFFPATVLEAQKYSPHFLVSCRARHLRGAAAEQLLELVPRQPQENPRGKAKAESKRREKAAARGPVPFEPSEPKENAPKSGAAKAADLRPEDDPRDDRAEPEKPAETPKTPMPAMEVEPERESRAVPVLGGGESLLLESKAEEGEEALDAEAKDEGSRLQAALSAAAPEFRPPSALEFCTQAAAEAAAGDESAMHFDGPSSTMDSCPSAFDGMVFDVPSQGCFDGQMGFDGGFDGPMRFDGAQEGCFNGPMAFDGPVPHGDPVVGFDAHPYAGPCGAHGAHGAAHAYGGHPMSYDAQPFEGYADPDYGYEMGYYEEGFEYAQAQDWSWGDASVPYAGDDLHEPIQAFAPLEGTWAAASSRLEELEQDDEEEDEKVEPLAADIPDPGLGRASQARQSMEEARTSGKGKGAVRGASDSREGKSGKNWKGSEKGKGEKGDAKENKGERGKKGREGREMTDGRQWAYIDPRGNIQMGFSSSRMRNWFQNGFFQEHLEVALMRESGQAPPRRAFRRLREIFPDLDRCFL